jgi:hypothetical protein
MAKVSTPNSSPAIEFLANSHNWRLLGLEITTSYVSTTNTVYNLVLSDGSSSTSLATMPSYVIFDRIYIHGLSTTNTTRGILMDFASVGIVDSYCDEIHYNGNDSQCFLAYNGPGPFLIQNAFIQAAGENILFGGSDPAIANLVPSDITVVGNLIQKNLAWDGEAAPYNWVIKNLFELKNAQRVLLDGNFLQYTWSAAQAVSVIIRAINQDGNCPWCVVQDVTVTHNLIQHAPGGFTIAGTDPDLSATSGTQRILVQNNVLFDISAVNWGASHGWGFQLQPGQVPMLNNLTIDHNTTFIDTTFTSSTPAYIYMGDSGVISNAQITNNIANYGWGGIEGNGTAQGTVSLTTWAPGYIYNDMVFINATGASVGTFPSGTYWNTNTGVEFTNYLGGNYQLTSGSPYHNAGTDGHDIGVWDWTTFISETANAFSGIYIVN